MKLYVAATGSSANSYVLSSDDGASLILDAGVSLKKVLPNVPDIRRIIGCVITHEHMDHARSWQEYAYRGIPCYTSAGTCETLTEGKANGGLHFVRMKPMQTAKRGPFIIMPFEVQHDAREPFGFLIRYEPTGETVLYATDTYYLRYTFPGVNYWLVECNHCENMIDAETDLILRKRLKESHMSLRRLKDTLAANDLRDTGKIVLVHLSDSRSDEARMISEIKEQTGIETVAASAGMTIELQRTPF